MNVIVLSVGYIGQHQQQDVGRGKIKLLLTLSSQKNTLLRKFLRFFLDKNLNKRHFKEYCIK